MSLSNIRIVLVNASHPGNIGAAARAMKNMCLEKLVLVSPRAFPDEETNARAAGADDVLDRAQVCHSLDEAIQGCRLVIGSSARLRTITWPRLDPPVAAARLVSEAAEGPVALLFGSERTGLTNDQLDRCHFLTAIPANAEFSSLNLASAVQVLAYEVYLASLDSVALPLRQVSSDDSPLASAEELHYLYQHLEETLIQIQFLDPQNPRKLMRRLTRLYNRARLDANELNILRGILTAVQQGWPRNT